MTYSKWGIVEQSRRRRRRELISAKNKWRGPVARTNHHFASRNHLLFSPSVGVVSSWLGGG